MTRLALSLFFAVAATGQEVLPGTLPLTPNADFSAAMVAGADKVALALTEKARADRRKLWPGDLEAHRLSLLRMIGAADARKPLSALELVGDTSHPALLVETAKARILRVRWLVQDGLHGEGILIQPKTPPVARVIYLPDADTKPETLADDAMLTYSGCEIVIPALLDRGAEFSTSPRFGVVTDVSHREWIYRQAFSQGQSIIGLEVKMVLSLMDYFGAQPTQVPTLAAGVGEGGLIAFYATAVDKRIGSAYIGGYFGPREKLWKEPLDRNIVGLLREFGDAEIAALIAPRQLAIQQFGFPNLRPVQAKPGVKAIAAPGKIEQPTAAETQEEIARAQEIVPGPWLKLFGEEGGVKQVMNHLLPPAVAEPMVMQIEPVMPVKNAVRTPVDVTRTERQVRELGAFCQRLLVSGEAQREQEFWKPLPLTSVAAFEASIAPRKSQLWGQVLGRLPDPDVPMNPQSRLIKETANLRIYEVTLDVWDGVFAWGWLALPKNLPPGQRRPVVVCQHGLDGVPQDCFDEDEKGRPWGYYKAFALKLAERGYIVLAPHNLYRGREAFRSLHRKLSPLGFNLFSVIVGQHQRWLEWLRAQSFVQADRIGFYGLSYGGKSAMRIPAVLDGYCLSICSGDFNEWVRKLVSTDMKMSYVFTPEFEIWDWNLGGTFNYAEMAALIAPRPFMVERGHDDGVGVDEWVDYEYSKVRRLYDKLGIGERTTIEHFNGPHTIHGVGTFEFLERWLGKP